MSAFLATLTPLQKFFFACAAFGGILFLARTVLMFVGVGDGDMGDADIGGDADSSFTLLSLHGLTAFFMMFGLVGLALSKQSGVGDPLAVVGSLAAGGITVWIIGRIFVGMKKLQSDGTLKMQNAVGQEGTVYLTISAGGTGKIRLTVQDQLRIFDAVAADPQETIKTDARVRVTQVVSGNILMVERV